MNVFFDLTIGLEVWGAVFTLLIFIAVCMEKEKTKNRYYFAAMQLTCFIYIAADILSRIARGKTEGIYQIITRISIFLFYFCGYLLLLLFCIQVFYGLQMSRGKRLFQKTVYAVLVMEFLLLIFSQFNDFLYYYDAGNYYHRSQGYIFSQSFVMAVMVSMICFILINIREFNYYRRISMLCYAIIPLTGFFLQMIMYGTSFICSGMVFSNIMAFFVTRRELQMENLANQRKMISQREKLFDQEKEIHDMNYRIVMSQIKPHFLYNALNAIYYLCESDPLKAQKAIEDFSEYLRGNMKFIQADQAVPFEEALQHIRHYLSLEKVRFEEDLKIIYDIREKDFNVPALSIQPIIENAVKHGVGKKEEGGFVKLSTDRIDDYYRIIVEDDGIGFNKETYLNDGKLHIGLENVRTRLRRIVNGEIEIDSKLGEGTKVTILIPVNGEEQMKEKEHFRKNGFEMRDEV